MKLELHFNIDDRLARSVSKRGVVIATAAILLGTASWTLAAPTIVDFQPGKVLTAAAVGKPPFGLLGSTTLVATKQVSLTDGSDGTGQYYDEIKGSAVTITASAGRSIRVSACASVYV